MSGPIRDPEADDLRRQVLEPVFNSCARNIDIAHATGISDASIGRIIDGTQALSLDNAVRLARWAGYEVRLVARGDGAS